MVIISYIIGNNKLYNGYYLRITNNKANNNAILFLLPVIISWYTYWLIIMLYQ